MTAPALTTVVTRARFIKLDIFSVLLFDQFSVVGVHGGRARRLREGS